MGEIVGKADGQMTGFWNNPEATAERMVDGWVKTGDVGYLDANGYLYMVDRAGDMIVSGGFNIYPAELENALCDHPDVIEAAVFGIPHERWGETPCAVCTVRPNAAVSEAELIALCEEKLGNYKRPEQGRAARRSAAQDAGGQDQAQGVARAVLGRPYAARGGGLAALRSYNRALAWRNDEAAGIHLRTEWRLGAGVRRVRSVRPGAADRPAGVTA